MPERFPQPSRPAASVCQRAHDVLGQATHACQSFHNLFTASRGIAGRGASTDAQQDTLRAMLVFACAGLDSALKQLIRDALAPVIDRDRGAHENFKKNVERKLPDIERSRDLLASVLTAENPRQHLMERMMDELVSGSLQNVSEVAKIAAAFNVKSSELGDLKTLKEAFDARNQIIHEMDINFSATRSRRQRKRADMERLTQAVLDLAYSLLSKVDEKLGT